MIPWRGIRRLLVALGLAAGMTWAVLAYDPDPTYAVYAWVMGWPMSLAWWVWEGF